MVMKKNLAKNSSKGKIISRRKYLAFGWGEKIKGNATLQMSHPPSSTALSKEEEETDLGPAAGPSLTDPAGG